MKSERSSQNGANPLEDLTRELEMLQKERLKAIDLCEFSKAKTIDCHIERLKERIKATKQSTNYIQNVLAFELKKEEVRYEAIRYQTEARDRIFMIRQHFQARQMALHKNHTDALTQVAEGYSSAIEIESLRINPQSESMVRQAKLYAKDKNYSVAESLFSESNALRETSSIKRQEEVDRVFENKKQYLERKHQMDLDLCAEKEEIAVEEVINNYQKDIKKLKNIIAKAAYELDLELSPQDIGFLDDLTIEQTELKTETPKKTPTNSPRAGMRTPNSERNKATPTSARRGTSTTTPTRRRTPTSKTPNSKTSTSRTQTPTRGQQTPSSLRKQNTPSSVKKQTPRTVASPRVGFSPA
ncbi:hypothetical protein TRFO_38394 [Tritrichomonas foetus]|uniref:Uncharacterized protein n=1 Tax=Tritrichomonas foetus TaxID=1144522 RepID=A0A1J4JCV7_9EUKA|nr:hypothetical protein TRFO_38394 [Tritrichomonas foetus]|eukprot:OHS95499.1 hypothetical protein TRFO_38394 [Tritrichomonas foetus]